MTVLHILQAGPATTLQDRGRHGFLRFGVTPAGPMDWFSHQLANRLLENPPDAAVIEIGPTGLICTAPAGPLRLAVVAPGFSVERGKDRLPGRVALTLQKGQRLIIRPGPAGGMWAYLALPGGVDAPPVMGSRATHLRSGLGPGPVQTGDTLQAVDPGRAAQEGQPDQGLILPPLPPGPDALRYVPGPQDDLFGPDSHAALQAGPYAVSPRSDRMAYRLTGPPLPALAGHDIVSDGIAMGAIQVPGDGQPFVLMADRQPTGGYPKIGTVIRADLPILAQLRPGVPFRFIPVTIDAAVAALQATQDRLAHFAPHLRRLRFAAG
ncbi:MAG: biotin-dependent carboxyltransferase family protein [Rhodobacteraceae bacterium]|jgi:5-oxoprolinase (ATP-hydrolysing) subunit C|nr:biotin-dependent carboxyltransferase family protein [Paracoccaceae bacterium]